MDRTEVLRNLLYALSPVVYNQGFPTEHIRLRPEAVNRQLWNYWVKGLSPEHVEKVATDIATVTSRRVRPTHPL